MFYLPLFHRFDGRECLVIGGGQTALRKLRWLLRTDAQIKVVAPEILPEIVELANSEKLQIEQKAFYPEALHPDLALVICATNAEGVSEEAYAIASQRRQWINCVDRTDLCTVIFQPLLIVGLFWLRSPVWGSLQHWRAPCAAGWSCVYRLRLAG